MNNRIKFPLAKLLKEQGFDQRSTDYGYKINGEESHDYILDMLNGVGIASPTIAEVVMWLYEKHGIWISPQPFIRLNESVVWLYDIFKNNYIIEQLSPSNGFNSPAEAYESGIEYVLNNLI